MVSRKEMTVRLQVWRERGGRCFVLGERRLYRRNLDPKPSSNHADKLAARVVTQSFPW
jgi:hypothetical protein